MFTVLGDDFMFESPVKPNNTIWNLVLKHLDNCRDITNNKSIQDGARCGRLRMITQNSEFSPTLLKSMARLAKDTLVIAHNGRYYYPSEELQKAIIGIEHFNLDCVSQDIGSEIIGQGVCSSLHSMVARSVKRHIENHF